MNGLTYEYNGLIEILRSGWYVVVNGCRLWCAGMNIMHCILKISEAFF